MSKFVKTLNIRQNRIIWLDFGYATQVGLFRSSEQGHLLNDIKDILILLEPNGVELLTKLTILSTIIVLVILGAYELWLIGAIANVCDDMI